MSQSVTRIRATWLSRNLNSHSVYVAAAVAFIIALVSLVHWDDVLGASKSLTASRDLVYAKGEYWRLWTATLVHSDFRHLLSNLFLFFILGWFLYGYFGSILFPISALIAGGLINTIILLTYEPFVTLLGASGIVFYMGGLWLTLYFLIQRQHSLTQRILRSGGVGLALFMPSEAFDPSISYRTHFLGFAVGAIVGIFYFYFFKQTLRSAEAIETILEEPEISLEESQNSNSL